MLQTRKNTQNNVKRNH